MTKYSDWKTKKAVDTAISQLYSFLELYEKQIDISLIRDAIHFLEDA